MTDYSVQSLVVNVFKNLLIALCLGRRRKRNCDLLPLACIHVIISGIFIVKQSVYYWWNAWSCHRNWKQIKYPLDESQGTCVAQSFKAVIKKNGASWSCLGCRTLCNQAFFKRSTIHLASKKKLIHATYIEHNTFYSHQTGAIGTRPEYHLQLIKIPSQVRMENICTWYTVLLLKLRHEIIKLLELRQISRG